MPQPYYSVDLLKFVHLRRARKQSVAVPVCVYPSEPGSFTTPNFYNTLLTLPEEDKKIAKIKEEADLFSTSANFIADEPTLESKIPNLVALTKKVIERAENNTNETFWGDVNSIMGQPPADYVGNANYNTNLSLLWDNVIAGLFLTENAERKELLAKSLVILRLIKYQVDDWNTPINKFYKASVLIPSWLHRIYQTKQSSNDDGIGSTIPNNQDYQDAIKDMNKCLLALDDLLMAYPAIKEGTNKVSISEVKTVTKDLLDVMGLVEDGEFELEKSIKLIRKRLSEIKDKYPKRTKTINSIVVGGTLISSKDFCADMSAPLDPCMQHEAQDFKQGDNYYSKVFVGDLMVTKQYLAKYELGEIAHVETAMKNSKKVRIHRRLNRTEITELFERESTKEEERENQTTDRFSMERQTSQTVNTDMQIDAGVNVSADFGIVQLNSSLGFSYGVSSTQTSQDATSFSNEVTSRALKKVKQAIKESKTITTIQEIEEKAEYTVNNAPTEPSPTAPFNHINGVYRWLDKRYLNKVYNYGQRLMFEFMIPEPGHFYIFRQIANTQVGEIKIKPEHPKDLEDLPALESFKDISLSHYDFYAARYGVTDVKLPPQPYKMVNKPLKVSVIETEQEESYPEGSHAEEGIQIPIGYKAKIAYVRVRFSENYPISTQISPPVQVGASTIISTIVVLVGKEEIKHGYYWRIVNGTPVITADNVSNSNGFYTKNLSSSGTAEMYSGEGSVLPVTCKVTNYWGNVGMSAIVNVEVLFERIDDEALNDWKRETYAAIMLGYERQKAEYEEWLSQQQLNAIEIEGDNPLINRQTEKEELKKRCIELFSGQRFESFDAATNGISNVSGYPEIRFEETIKEGIWVKYYEQVFDWQNMLYIFYPYFYGRKNNWLSLKALSNPDPLFLKFLQAGYARVVVPIRPGFEKYVLDGKLGLQYWTEEKDPTYMVLPENLPTLDILSEIMSTQDIDPEEIGENRKVGQYMHTVPTNLVYIIPENATPPYVDLPDNTADLGL